MPSIFDNLKPAKISNRNDDGVGRYWQRFDKLSIELDQSKKNERLQILKTNLHVFEGQKPVGEQVSHAIFPDRDARYSFFEKDVKRLLQAIFSLKDEEVNDLRKATLVKKFLEKMKATNHQAKIDVDENGKPTAPERPLNETEIKMLDDVQTLAAVLKNVKGLNDLTYGQVYEARVSSKPNPKNVEKPYLTVRYTRSVPDEEIKRTLPETRLKEFGLA